MPPIYKNKNKTYINKKYEISADTRADTKKLQLKLLLLKLLLLRKDQSGG